MVFVCEHGAAKSVLAAALLERLAAERGVRLRALARGTEPEPQVVPAVVAGLLVEGIDVGAWQPRLVTRDDLTEAWRVVSFGPDLSQLRPVGTLVQVWSDVPAVADGFQAAQAAMVGRLCALLEDLPEQRAARAHVGTNDQNRQDSDGSSGPSLPSSRSYQVGSAARGDPSGLPDTEASKVAP